MTEDSGTIAWAMCMFLCVLIVFSAVTARCSDIPEHPTRPAPALPDAPLPQAQPPFTLPTGYQCSPDIKCYEEDRPIHVWTFRKSWQDPPLRTKLGVFKSKYFWVSTGAMWTAMAVACSRRGTREEFHSEVPGVAAVTGFYWIMSRYGDELYGVGMAGYGVGHYIWTGRR